MDRLLVLVKGEFNRLNKYNLFTAHFVVLMVWVGLAWFFEAAELKAFVPFIFLMDATMMTILLVGATLFYEKQEHTINSIMVSPVTGDQYLLSKVVVNVLNSFVTVVFISAALYFMKGVVYNYFLLVPAVVVVAASHTIIGIWLSYHAKSFSSLLVNYIIYVFVFLLPTVLAMLGIIGEAAARFLIVLPPDTANILISAMVREVDPWRLVFGYAYLILLSVVLYRYIVRPWFDWYVMREVGV